MPKKILIVTDDAGESFEILYAQYRFREAGYTPVIAASKKKLLHGVIHDFEPGWTTYVERPGYWIQADLAFAAVKPAQYEAIVLIGGRAPEHLRHDDGLLRLVRDFQRRGKLICAICHGIQIVLAAGLGRGKRMTCYRNVRFEVQQCGGTWIDEQSVVDGNLITAQTWESHAEFYRNIFAALEAGRNAPSR
jgi:protease I